MKTSSSKINKIVYALIVAITLTFISPLGGIAEAMETTGEEALKAIIDEYAGQTVQIRDGLSWYSGQVVDYKELISEEERNINFKLTSRDENVVKVEGNNFIAVAPGNTFISLENENGVNLYEILVRDDNNSGIAVASLKSEGVTPRAATGYYRVVLDPGHGGYDGGASGNGLVEKNLTLAIAQKVEMLLKAKGVEVVMTRTTDVYKTLDERSTIGNNSGADIFTSIHINAGGGTGIETYYYPGKTQSGKLASNVQSNMISNTGAVDRKVKTEDHHVTRETNITSILTECGFIDTTSDANKLRTTSYQQLLAQGITNGIMEYLQANITLPFTSGTRIAGLTRFETSYDVAKLGWSSADTAVIAAGMDYPDALCAAPLAGKYNAPILLAENKSLSNQTELKGLLSSLGVKKVYIVGGPTALSQGFEQDIKAMSIETVRLGGIDRYETSIKIAEEIGNSGQIAVATGLGFADSLSMSAVAAKNQMPILLTETNQVPSVIKNYLNGKTITKTYVIGGTTVISDNVANSFNGVTRLGGLDRYETNKKILNEFKGSLNLSNTYLALGTNFPDALSVSSLAGKNGSFVLLSNKVRAEQSLLDVMGENRAAFTKIYVLGGSGIINDGILSSLSIRLN